MAERKDPDSIQREIEQTRAELAATIDAIADRVSPRRAAARGATRVKTAVGALRGNGSPNGHAPTVETPLPGRSVLAPPDGEGRIRPDRVAIAVAAVIAVIAVVVVLARRAKSAA